MKRPEAFRNEVRKLLGIIFLGLMIGAAVSYPLAGLCAGFIFAFAMQLYRLRKLHSWLVDPKDCSAPHDGGIWEDIADHFQDQQRAFRRQNSDLHAVINRIHQVTTALTDGIVVIDSMGRVEWWNPAATKLLGLREATDRGQLVVNLLRHPAFVKFMKKGKFKKMLEIPAPHSQQRTLQIQVTEFGVSDRLMVVRDITQQMSLDQMRKDFVANVSHELRTPLTVISGYVEALQSGDLPDRLRRALEQMEGQSRRMEALISDLLTLAKLESRALEATEKQVKVYSVLRQIADDARSLSGGKHEISLDCPEDAVIMGSKNELRSAFSNLVFNAVKYSPNGGNIQLRWGRDGGNLCFCVSDEGMGIDEKHIPRLTERFYRADDSRNSSTGGTGLGLAIVKHILVRHDGVLNIESTLGKGSRFTCCFPITRYLSLNNPLEKKSA